MADEYSTESAPVLRTEHLECRMETVASGGVYSAFAVGTASAGSLNVILVQDNASSTEPLPSTGGISPMWLGSGFAAMGVMLCASVGVGAYALRHVRAKD